MSLFQPSYVLFVGVSVLLATAFPVTKHIRGKKLRRDYYWMQVVTILGAVFGAKVSVLIGDYRWPWNSIPDWHMVLTSGRSITGALIFGFLFAEIAKPLAGYRMPPNDRFAALLPFTIGIGRIGCLMAGCCGGIPCDAWWAIHGSDGVPRYPTQIFELIFQFAIGIAFIAFVKRGIFFGRLFSLYLMIYGVFRFLTEYVRDTPKFFNGFSGYQWLSLVMIAVGGAFFLKRTVAPPADWMEFRTNAPKLETKCPNQELSHV